jgi:hypothetical protein
MLEAERQFRRIIGYRDLTTLAVAIERDLARMSVPSPTEGPARPTGGHRWFLSLRQRGRR